MQHFVRAWVGIKSSQGEEENDLHPADVMEQNHNNVEGEGDEEAAEEPRDDDGLEQEQQPRVLKRQLIGVKMEPGGGVR